MVDDESEDESDDEKEDASDGVLASVISQRPLPPTPETLVFDDNGVIKCDNKMTVFKQKVADFNVVLDAWKASPASGPKPQLVVFAHDTHTVVCILKELEETTNMDIYGVGTPGQTRAVSKDIIESLQNDVSPDVLIMTLKWRTGLNLRTVSHLFIFSQHRATSTTDQAIGRFTRLGRVHGRLTLLIFVYEQSYDHLLWVAKDTIGDTLNFAIPYRQLMEKFMTSEVEGSPFNQFAAVAKHVSRFVATERAKHEKKSPPTQAQLEALPPAEQSFKGSNIRWRVPSKADSADFTAPSFLFQAKWHFTDGDMLTDYSKRCGSRPRKNAPLVTLQDVIDSPTESLAKFSRNLAKKKKTKKKTKKKGTKRKGGDADQGSSSRRRC